MEIQNYENKFEIFNYKNLGSVRTFLDERSEVWFCLTDVCRILEIKNASQLSDRLNGKGICNIYTLTNGGPQNIIFINEPNLYETIFKSRKPEAEDLKQWVFNEVLPSLRRNGYYDMRNMSPSEKTAFVIQCMNEDLQGFKKEIRQEFNTHVKTTENHLKDFEENIAEMVAENKRIENTVRIGFRTIEAFIAYLGVSPDSIDKYDFAFDVETRCEELFLAYVDTDVPGFGRYKAYPFDVMMEVYEKKINN